MGYPPISSYYQMARQTQRGRGFGGEVKGTSSLTQKGEQYTPLISDLDAVAWPGTAPTQGPQSAPLMRI
jgi:hypothetical protein